MSHPLRRTQISEIWAKQKTEISSRRFLAKLKCGRMYPEGVSGERSCPQDCNDEENNLIRQPVRELFRKYRKWPKMESNPLVFFRFSTFFKFSKLWWQMKGVNFPNPKMCPIPCVAHKSLRYEQNKKPKFRHGDFWRNWNVVGCTREGCRVKGLAFRIETMKKLI